MKISICPQCGFKTKEKNKICPLCNHQTELVERDDFTYEINLPSIINHQDEFVRVGYYCFKCRKMMTKHVCLDCNNMGSFCIEYHKKKAIIKRINNLNEVFTDEEIRDLLSKLRTEEKYWIYHNFESAFRYFYKIDKTKASACFFFGIIMYLLGLSIASNYANKDMVFISYFASNFGNALLSIFGILGVWYLIDASKVEYQKIPISTSIISAMTMLAYTVICIFLDFNFSKTFYYGFIAIGVNLLIYLVYLLMRKKA